MLGISKKEKKPEEPQYYMSRVQMPVMNYKVYHMGKVEKILTFMLAFVIGAAVAYLFYGGLFKDEYGNATTATWISNIVIMLVVGIIAGRMFVPIRTKSIIDKNQRKLKEQFRSMLEAVNTSLGAGNNAIDSFESAYRDLRVQYEEDAFILKELNVILVSNRNNIDIETVLKDFGERSGIDFKPYRYLNFWGDTGTAKVEGEIKKGLKNMGTGLFSGMGVQNTAVSVDYKTYGVYAKVEAEMSYSITMPVKLLGQEEASKVEFQEYIEVPAMEGSEIVRNVNMVRDIIDRNETASGVMEKASEYITKFRQFAN